MKILIVSQYFYPENFRINDLAIELKNRGHEVSILTGIPNYPQGKFYEGYTMFKNRFHIFQDMEIHRVPIFPRYKGALRLSMNYLSFVVFGCYKAKVMKKKDFDVIYAFGTSPITQALPAITMKKRIHAPVLLNVQDLWPENVIVMTGLKNRLVIKYLDRLVDYIYNSCDMILGSSNSFVKCIREREHLKKKDKVVFWPQYSVVSKAPDGVLQISEPLDNFQTDKFNIVFTGNVGEAQGISMVVEAAGSLKDTNIRWHIVGDGRDRERVENMAREQGVQEYITFHGSRLEKDIPQILNGCDAALMIIRPDPIFEKTIPAKFQTYLSCGCAILGCMEGEIKELIQAEKVGLCTDFISGEQLAIYARKMSECTKEEMADFRKNALFYSGELFDKEKIISKLEEYMEKLL